MEATGSIRISKNHLLARRVPDLRGIPLDELAGFPPARADQDVSTIDAGDETKSLGLAIPPGNLLAVTQDLHPVTDPEITLLGLHGILH